MSLKRTIWKYTVPIETRFDVSMPGGAKVISVQDQGGRIEMWAIVYPSVPNERRSFYIGTTGNDLPTNATKFVGTFQLANGLCVGHLFEVK